jgi:hypothetical protein
MLGMLHPAIEVRKVHNSRHVGIREFHATGCGELCGHGGIRGQEIREQELGVQRTDYRFSATGKNLVKVASLGRLVKSETTIMAVVEHTIMIATGNIPPIV